MQTENDDNVLDYCKLANRNYIMKFKKTDDLNGDKGMKNRLPSHLVAFILSNSRRNLNNFIREINGFYSNSIYYTDTDKLYIGKKNLDVLDKAGLFRSRLCQGKSSFKSGGKFYGIYLSSETKYVLTRNEIGVMEKQKTFHGFNNSKRLLDPS